MAVKIRTSEICFIMLILFINGLTNASVYNLLLTVPQIIFIIYLIVKGDFKRAIVWHIIFFITSYSYYGSTTESIDLIASYNYAKLKLIGPISFSHVLALVIFIYVSLKNKKKIDTIYTKFVSMIKTLMLIGFGIGFFGLLLRDYYLEGFIKYGSYIFIIFLHSYMLLVISDNHLKNKIYRIALTLLIVNPIVQFMFLNFFPDFTDASGITFYSVLLIPALLFEKKVLPIIIGLIFHTYNMIVFGASSGKGIILIVVFVILTVILSFLKDLKKEFPVRTRVLRIGAFYLFISIPAIASLLASIYGGGSFTVSKIHQVTTLFEFTFFGGNISNIAPSPYVRITSLINILYEGLQNPFALIFGKGYGGYFLDNFNYFDHLNLYGGSAFPNDAITSGEFYTGHDTLVTIPMFNGLFGLFIIMRYIFKSFKKLSSNMNYLLLASIPFLLFVFYFDTLIGVSGVFLLYAGSLNKKYSHNKLY